MVSEYMHITAARLWVQGAVVRSRTDTVPVSRVSTHWWTWSGECHCHCSLLESYWAWETDWSTGTSAGQLAGW